VSNQNKYEQLRLISLRNVLSDDNEYHLRYIARWYSREFSTPLHEVYDLPIDFLLSEYYECSYAAMMEGTSEQQAELEEAREAMLASEEKRKEKKLDEDKQAFEVYEFEKAIRLNPKLAKLAKGPSEDEPAPLKIEKMIPTPKLAEFEDPPPQTEMPPDFDFQFDPEASMWDKPKK